MDGNQGNGILIGARVSPEVRRAIAKLAERRSGTIAGEVRSALAMYLRDAAREEAARRV